jgi:DNA-directed RNA polymerase specialized sigma subunit
MPLSDLELKQVSKTWDEKTWENYLDWYQSPRHESLVDSNSYDILCDRNADNTVYEEFGYETDEAWQSYCERLLKTLPQVEEKVIRLYLYEGLTELEIAKRLNRSQCGVHLIKKRAILRLQKQASEADLIALRIMRGLVSQNVVETASPWDSVGPDLIQEALQVLSENQRLIIYLRYLCDQPLSFVARQLGIGINIAQEICDVAVFKIKSHMVSEMNTKMEVPSCA